MDEKEHLHNLILRYDLRANETNRGHAHAAVFRSTSQRVDITLVTKRLTSFTHCLARSFTPSETYESFGKSISTVDGPKDERHATNGSLACFFYRTLIHLHISMIYCDQRKIHAVLQ